LSNHATEIASRDLSIVTVKRYFEQVAVTYDPELAVACAFAFIFLKAKID